MTFTEILAADALKLFKKAQITVQEAVRVKRTGDDGKIREAFDVAQRALKAEHILSAKDLGDRVSITTIDGQRYEAAKADAGVDAK
jgi:cation transport regulator ChaB